MRVGNKKKSRQGGAYIMVVIAALAVFVLIFAVLNITAASRNITGRYAEFYGLYDISVAGNEQALYVIERGLERNRATALARAHENGTGFRTEIMPLLRNELANYFRSVNTADGPGYEHRWGLSLRFTKADTVEENEFRALTTVIPLANGTFGVTTIVYENYYRTVFGITFTERRDLIETRSNIIWRTPQGNENYMNFLDYYTVEMVELMRISR